MPDLIKRTFTLARGPWKTLDPFLFCVFHRDEYPAGTANLGPDSKLLRSRDIGSDFSYEDGWSMYHGQTVPGFPEHPHRGFETITVTRCGLVDHFDSLGATGRYGLGDTQWMTAGKGVQHCEMFPLVHRDGPNTMELFQIWINLPKRSKFVDADYKMFWAEETPTVTLPGNARVRVVAGNPSYFANVATISVPPPPAASYAAQPEADVAVWEIKLPSDAEITLPPAIQATANRAIYFFRGGAAKIGDTAVKPMTGAEVDASQPLRLSASGGEAEFLLLQGRPIGEPVAQYGPFVMNTQQEIQQAFADFRATRFGGWPWDRSDPTNGPDPTRFAKFADGRIERPPGVTK